MTSIRHAAGIWSVSDDDSTSNDHTKDTTKHPSPYRVPSLVRALSNKQTSIDREAVANTLGQDITASNEPPSNNATVELVPVQSHAGNLSTRQPSHTGLAEEQGSPRLPISQGIPPELPNLLAEVIFVLTCSGGQLVSALLIGQVAISQTVFGDALGIPPSQVPWLLGSSNLAAGLSVIASGSLSDLIVPKPLMVWGFVWAAIWNVIAAVAISPRLKVLFFVARAMQGLAAGVLVSASMSILGRVYSPGIRKTRVFSLMAAFSPVGYWLGCLQSGGLSSNLPWIFGSTSIFLVICAVAAQLTIPALPPAKDNLDTEAPSLRQFDYLGAGLASAGCSLIIFGLTQGSSAHWSPYTYCTLIVGFLLLAGFYFVEKRVIRPLIPNRLWQTPGFPTLLLSYFLGLGAYSEFLIPW
jgi:MFS family permease